MNYRRTLSLTTALSGALLTLLFLGHMFAYGLPDSRLGTVASTAQANVSIQSDGFFPQTITVSVGSVVMWTNNSGVEVRLIQGTPYRLYLPSVLKNVSSPSLSEPQQANRSAFSKPLEPVSVFAPDFDSVTIQPGESFTFTFDEVGLYPYWDGLAPQHTGLIIVEELPAQEPDLVLTVTADNIPVSPGQSITYTLHYSNQGGLPAGSTVISETLPQGTSFEAFGSSAGWQVNGNDYVFPLGDIAPGTSGSVTFVVTVDPDLSPEVTQILNQVMIASNSAEADPSNNYDEISTSVLHLLPDLHLNKHDGGLFVSPGSFITYTLSYTNQGNVSAAGVVISDTLPDGTEFHTNSLPGWNLLGGSSYIYDIGEVAVGDSGAITLVVSVDEALPYTTLIVTNTATIHSNAIDLDNGNNRAVAGTPIVHPLPNLMITKDDGDIATLPGDFVTYTLTISNTGTKAALGVVLTETVPAHSIFQAERSTPGWTQVGNTNVYTMSANTIDIGGQAGFTFTVLIETPFPAGTNSITNVASVSDDGSNGPDANPTDNSVSVETAVLVPPTQVCGDINSDTTWYQRGSPYIVTCTVIVQDGAELIIQPGTEVRFAQSQGLRVYGQLNAIGTIDSPITFTADNGSPTAGYWDGIDLYSGGEAVIEHATIEYGGSIAGSFDAALYVYYGKLNLRNTIISDSGTVGVLASVNAADSLILQANMFTNIAGRALTINSNQASMIIEGNQGADNGTNAIYLGGTFTGTTTLSSNSELPFFVSPDITLVPSGRIDLTAGTIMKMSSGRNLFLSGQLHALGTLAEPIIITAGTDDTVAGDTNNDGNASTPTPGYWNGIIVSDGGVLNLQHTTVRYGGERSSGGSDGNVQIEDGTLTASDCSFDYSYDYGVDIVSGLVTVTNSSFTGNDRYAANIDLRGLQDNPVFSGLSADGNGSNAIRISYTVSGSLTLPGNIGLPYISSYIHIEESSQLIFEPGAQLKMESTSWGRIDVDGRLVSQGTNSNPVQITSFKDDAVAGDTNGDGAATLPAPGNWCGIRVSAGGEVDLDYTQISYGGCYTSGIYGALGSRGGMINVTNSTFDQNIFPIYAEGGQLSVEDSLFTNNLRRGIVLRGVESPTIRNSDFTNTSYPNEPYQYGYPVELSVYSVPSSANFENLSASGNDYNGILFHGTITGTSTLPGSAGLAYIVEYLTVAEGAQLSVASGAIIKPRIGLINIDGHLQINGTASDPVIFTSIADDSVGGDTNNDGSATSPDSYRWQGIQVGAAGILDANYTDFLYGGISSGDSCAIRVNGGHASFNNSSVAYSREYGIYVDGGTLSMSDSIIHNNGLHGLHLLNVDNPVINDTQFQNNAEAAISFGSFPHGIQFNGLSASGNGVNGIHLWSTTVVGSVFLPDSGAIGLPFVARVITIPAGSSLTLNPGVQLKMGGASSYYGITVDGTLIAEGTAANRVRISDISDDSFGGDTESDAAATQPTPGSWEGIRINSTGTAELNHAMVAYGGVICGVNCWAGNIYNVGGRLLLNQSEIAFGRQRGVYSVDGDLKISRSEFHDNDGTGLYIDGGGWIEGSSFSDNAGVGIRVWMDSVNTVTMRNLEINGSYNPYYEVAAIQFYGLGDADMSGISGSGNEINAIQMTGSVLDTGSAAHMSDAGLPYFFDNFSVPLDTNLILQPGTVVKLSPGTNRNNFNIYGRLYALGEPGYPVIFTSMMDDEAGGDSNNDDIATSPSAGDWQSIWIHPDGDVIVRNSIIRYGGARRGSNPIINYGAIFNEGGQFSFINSRIHDNYGWGIYSNSGSGIVRNSSIYGHSSYGIYNRDAISIIDARGNYWGDPSGPDPYGSGDKINYRECSDGNGGTYICHFYVDATPWTGQQAEESTPVIEAALPPAPERDIMANAKPGVPFITSVRSAHNFFVFAVDDGQTDRLTIEVDWNGSDGGTGTPTFLEIRAGDEVYYPTASSTTVLFDLPLDNFNAGRTTLEIRPMGWDSDTGEALDTEVYAAQITRFTAPQWLLKLGFTGANINVKHLPEYSEATIDLKIPEEPIGSDIYLPDTIPYIGGWSAVKKTQAALAVSVRSDFTGSGKISGQTGFELPSESNTTVEIIGKVTGKAKVDFSGGELALTSASIGLDIAGKIKEEQPILTIFPIFSAFDKIPAINKILRRARVEGTVEPSIGVEFGVKSSADNADMEFLYVNGDGSLKLTLALVADLGKKVEASVYGGGSGKIELQAPPDPGYLDKVTGGVFIGAKVKAYGFKAETQRTWELVYEPAAAGLLMDQPLFSPLPNVWAVPVTEKHTTWAVDQPEYGNIAYAQFNNNPLDHLSLSATDTATEQLLVSNLYAEANPDIAVNGNQAVVAWVHDDIALLDSQSKEIRASYWNGVSWSSPIAVTSNNMSEFEPQIAFSGPNQLVAVWQRINDPALPMDSTLDMTLTRKLDLAYATFNPGNQTWSTPALLTNNGVLDHSHQLDPGNDGSLMLTWIANSAGDLVGSSTDPDTIWFAIWDGSSWSTPATVASGLAGVVDISLAYHDSDTATLVVSQDTDGDLGSEGDTEIYYTDWDGSAWSGLSQLTNNLLDDEGPQVIFTSSGQRRFVWNQDGRIMFLGDDWTADPVATEIESKSVTLIDFELTIDIADNLVMVWQGSGSQGTDIFYAIYDETAAVWTLKNELTSNSAVEKQLSPVVDNSGQLWVAFARDLVSEQSVVISPSLTITDVATYQSTDLYLLTYTPETDLILTNLSLPDYANNPWPGDTVNILATVQNAGDRAVSNPIVSFYDGDPEAGGTLITTTQVVSGALTGGASAELSIAWTVPVTTVQPHILYAVVDPTDSVVEVNESNNRLSLLTMVADVAVSSVRSYYYDQYRVVPMVVIANNGPMTATNALVEFRENSITGTVRYSETISSLEPFGLAVITTTWDVSAWTSGEHIYYAVVDSNALLTEVNESDNAAMFPVKVAPDMVIYAGDLKSDLTPGVGGVVTATIRNWGTAALTNGTVTLYEGPEISAEATALYTWTIDSLAIDSRVSLSTTIDHMPNRLFAIADPMGIITEVEESNNVGLLTHPISITFRYNDIENLVLPTATVHLEGDWNSDPITMTATGGGMYEVTISTEDSPLSYRYLVDGDPLLLQTDFRVVTPTVGIIYDDFLQTAVGTTIPQRLVVKTYTPTALRLE